MLDIFTTPDGLKRAIIAVLLKVSAVDGKKESELTYIHHVANQLGLDLDDIIEIEKHPDTYRLRPPADEQSRMTILYYLLFLMDVDGEVTQQEENIVLEFGFRLGFRTELTRELISLIKTYTNTGVSPDKMLEKIRAYLN